MTGKRQSRYNAGFSLLELIIAAFVSIVVCGIAAALVVQTRRATAEGAPMVERNGNRAAVLAEMVTSIQDAASKTMYVDTRAALATITRAGSGGGQSGPPDGYCLVVASDRTTWPAGFDPRDSSTWSAVEWWSGAKRDDPSTWYYNCRGNGTSRTGDLSNGKEPSGGGGGKDPGGGGGGSTPPGSVPHQFSITPVVSYGTGFVVGRRVTLAGPCAVIPESSDPTGLQHGPGLMIARTDPNFDTFTLSQPLSTSSGVIRLGGRDASQTAEITRLVAGDVLVVTGRGGAGAVVTTLVSLAEPLREVSAPTVGGASGQPLFRDFEARIDAPGETYLGYLTNTPAASEGVEIERDATVALLARDGAVVTYCASKVGGDLGLLRMVGNPGEAQYSETLIGGLSGPLEVAMLPEATAVGPAAGGPGGTSGLTTGVHIALPVSSGPDSHDAEPVESTVALLDAASPAARLALMWDVLEESSPGPKGGGSEGGGK